MTASTDSPMRLAPVAVRHQQDRATLRDVAARQSRTPHAAPEAVDACVTNAEVLADLSAENPDASAVRPRTHG